jgi:hypothetical protein
MITMTSRAAARPRRAPHLSWHVITGLAGAAAGGTIVAGAFLPWVEIFAGLIQIPGVHGGNGRILAAAGILIAVAGLYQVVRARRWSRWLTGIGGCAALGFSGYLLIQLAATTRNLGGNSMVLARGGPGLWVTAAGGLAAFGTLFLPFRPAVVPRARRPARSPALRVRARTTRQAIVSRTADLESSGVRRGLQIALGLLWLLDAALQFQPAMFGRAFVSQMLLPAAAAGPAALASPALWADHLIGHNVPAWNTAFALIQLALSLGLLWRPAVKAALAGSIAWALGVWWLGEGLGGVFSGTASPVTGAPGAAVLYVLLAVLAWPARSGAATARSPLRARWSAAAWLVLWGSFAFLILQPAVRAPRALHDALAAAAAGEPGWLAAVDRGAAAAAGSHGLLICAVLAAVFVMIAAGIAFPATVRPVLVLASVFGLASWAAGQNFGAIATGMGTDPSSGPLLVLLAAACWPPRRAAAPRGCASLECPVPARRCGDSGEQAAR